MLVILPSSTWLQLAVGTGGATEVCRSNQVIASVSSASRLRITRSVMISDILRSPATQSSALLSSASGPLKVTSSASSERSVSKSRSFHARMYVAAMAPGS